MSAKQAKVYREMTSYMQTFVDNKTLTAANSAAMLSKLMQISLGWVYDNRRGVIHLDNKARIQAMIDVVDSAARKVIILVPFKHALQGLSDALTLAGYENAPVSGDTPPAARDSIFNTFQNDHTAIVGPNTRRIRNKVLLAHPQCIAHGLTLTAADTILWFGPIMSSEIYDQATMRIRRIGQKYRQLFLHLQATAVERKYYGLLARRVNAQDALLAVLEDHSWASMNTED
jgi:SNF2 family DNA or RNA helicase